MDEEGELETWEYQGGTFTNVSSWTEVGSKAIDKLDDESITSIASISSDSNYQNSLIFHVLKESSISVNANIDIDTLLFKRGFFYSNNGSAIEDSETSSINATWYSPLIILQKKYGKTLYTDFEANVPYSFYDSNRTFISGGTVFNVNNNIEIPSNAYYIRYSIGQGTIKDKINLSSINIFAKADKAKIIDPEKIFINEETLHEVLAKKANKEDINEVSNEVDSIADSFIEKTLITNIAPESSEWSKGFWNNGIVADGSTSSSPNVRWISPFINLENVEGEITSNLAGNYSYAFYADNEEVLSYGNDFKNSNPISKLENAKYLRVASGAGKSGEDSYTEGIAISALLSGRKVIDPVEILIENKALPEVLNEKANKGDIDNINTKVDSVLNLFKISKVSINISPDKSKWIKGFFYNNNGNIIEDSDTTSPNSRWLTDEIDILSYEPQITTDSSINLQYCFYDSTHTYISGGGNFNVNLPITIPSNAVYVRFANTQTAADQSSLEIQYNIFAIGDGYVIDPEEIHIGDQTLPEALDNVNIDEEVEFDKKWATISTNVNPLYGKHFFSIGDSHTAVGQFQKYIAQQAGASNHVIQASVIDGKTYFSFDDDADAHEQTIGQNDYMDKILTAIESGVNMDYLIFEDTHLTEWGEIDDSIKPIQITTKQGIYPDVFASRQEAINKVTNEIADIVSTLGINSDQAGFTLKYQTSASQVLKFGFSSGSALNGTYEVSVIVDGVSFTRTLTEGMTLEECVFDLNDYEYSEDVDWSNEHKGEHGYTEITLNYIGTKTEGFQVAILNVPDECNLQLTESPTITQVTADIVYMYYGVGTEGLNTASNWLTNSGNLLWKTPNLLIGAIKYLKEHMPNCKIIFLGLPGYRSQNIVATYDSDGSITNDGARRADNSIDYRAILNSSTQQNARIARNQTKKVAEYFGDIQYINVYANSEITPENAYELPDGTRTDYYDWYNSHCRTEGYNAWARCILQFIE